MKHLDLLADQFIFYFNNSLLNYELYKLNDLYHFDIDFKSDFDIDYNYIIKAILNHFDIELNNYVLEFKKRLNVESDNIKSKNIYITLKF